MVALEPQFRRDMPPSFKVICQESLHRLALCQMTRSFNDVDDKEIATKIAQQHGLSAKAPTGTKEHILQGNITDAAFLRRIAQKNGNHLRIEGKKLIIGPPPKGADLQVAPGDGLKKIKVRIKSVQQVKEITVHGWDPKTKKHIVGKAKGEGEIGKGSKEHGGKATLSFAGHEHAPTDVASAESMAKGRMRKVAEGFVTAELELVGDPRIIPGARVSVEKIGPQIDGIYRIAHAHHVFNRHGYLVAARAVRVSKSTASARNERQAAGQARAQAAREQQAVASKAVVPLNWLALELKDQGGKPVAGEGFRIVLADGKIIDGQLDAFGKARVERVPAAGAKVVFTSRHSGDIQRK